jgi:hypothetical protein
MTPFRATGTFPYFVPFSRNGYEHGTMPLRALTMHKGEHVRWYVFAGTNDFDAHSLHWHGNTVVINPRRTDVTSLAPMQSGHGGHGARRRRRHLALPLPHFLLQCRRHGRPLRSHPLAPSGSNCRLGGETT